MNLKVAKKLYSGLVLSAGVLVIILVPLIITWFVRRQQQVDTSLCFHDDKLLNYGFEKSELLKDLILEYRNSTNGTNYCVKALEAFKHIAIKQVDLRYDTDINPEPPLFNLTEINCTLSDENPSLLHLKDIGTVTTKEQLSIIFWKTFMRDGNGITYNEEEGMIGIQKPGFYHITIQLTLRKNNASDAKSYEILKHWVMRISNTIHKESILLESANSPCELAVEKCEKSSYMAAVFRLELNDKIYVALSKQDHVALEQRNHFFSIIEL